MESCTIATAHEAGWLWDIGLNGARGIGCIYSSSHISDDRAADILRGYCGLAKGHAKTLALRSIPFAPGYREQQWLKQLRGGGAVGRFPGAAGVHGPGAHRGGCRHDCRDAAAQRPHARAPARRFNELMAARYENIINFLKLHYCLEQARPEPFWRDNANPAAVIP